MTLRSNLAQTELDFEPREGKYERDYREHRRTRPEVFNELAAAAREAKARGWTRLGIRALWERARWKRGPKPRDAQGFHLNDHLTRFYARDLMRECPDLDGLFETRARTPEAGE